MKRFVSTVLIAGLAVLATGHLTAQVPAGLPSEPVDSPHPWRFWEGRTKAAAHARAAAVVDKDGHPSQELYDVHHYDLVLDLDPQTETLTGSVTTAATITGGTLRQFVLDLDAALTVTAIESEGVPVPWLEQDDRLFITLPRDYLQGEQVAVTVSYQGNPEAAGQSFGWGYADGARLIWTLSEPYGARTWWPCKDLNTDKADSVDLHVAVPLDMVVASNGLLAGEESTADRRIFHWQERYPIVPYLVSVTAHPYTVFTDWYVSAAGDSLPIMNFVLASYENEARAGYAPTADMIAAFAEGFGEYPFMDEKYGHAHFAWGGGMEHQTCSSMLYLFYGEGLIAHELAHQWWGDMVTCADFHHIWLNEGFATWAEAYWKERAYGMQEYHAEMADAEYLGPGTIYVEDPDGFGNIFDGNLSYNKASWVVHMLRGVLGDEDFFAGLALYRQRFAYGSATTEDLQAVMEEVSGRDLEAFFQQWIYGEYFPRYNYSYLLTPQDGQTLVQLRIEQMQSNAGVFVMPIRMRLWTDGGYEWVTVENDRWIQNYSFTVPGTANFMELDPQKWILRQVLGGGQTAVTPMPRALALTCYPNPFNPQTTLALTLAEPGQTRLAVYDATGRLVRTLLDGALPAGRHQQAWDGRDAAGRGVAAGVYFARAEIAGHRTTTRLTLVR